MSTKTAVKVKKDIGLIFQGWGVKSILDGTKRLTRRMRGLDEINKNPNDWRFDGLTEHPKTGVLTACFMHLKTQEGLWIKSPYGEPGRKAWVRETHACYVKGEEIHHYVAYKASEKTLPKEWPNTTRKLKWTPSIHMKRFNSQINLEITSIWVERLQDISEEDAKAEGVPPMMRLEDGKLTNLYEYKDGFRQIWGAINGPKSWEVNPWVWVVGFKKV